MAKRRAAAPWGNRIVGTGTAPASSFLANPANWRIHPKPQQEVLAGVLDRIGFVQHVIVNRRSSPAWPRGERGVETLVDGHLRVQLALSRDDETPVPVTYVDLDPEEEAAVLASLDPIGAMAVADDEKLADVVAAMDDDLRALTAVLREERRGARRLVAFTSVAHHRVVVECADEAIQRALLQRLQGEGYDCRAE